MATTFNKEGVIAAVRRGAMLGVLRGLEDVRSEAVRLINNPPKTGRIYRTRGVSHQASAPGEAPAGDLGHLARNIDTEPEPTALRGRLVFRASYAQALEMGTSKMQARPYARRALAARLNEIQADIAYEIAEALRAGR